MQLYRSVRMPYTEIARDGSRIVSMAAEMESNGIVSPEKIHNSSLVCSNQNGLVEFSSEGDHYTINKVHCTVLCVLWILQRLFRFRPVKN